MAVGESALRKTLRDLLDRWDSADAAVKRAQGRGEDDPDALAARQAAEAECWALQAELADLLLCLLRCAVDNKDTAEGLRKSLMGLLGPEVVKIVVEILTEKDRHDSKR